MPRDERGCRGLRLLTVRNTKQDENQSKIDPCVLKKDSGGEAVSQGWVCVDRPSSERTPASTWSFLVSLLMELTVPRLAFQDSHVTLAHRDFWLNSWKLKAFPAWEESKLVIHSKCWVYLHLCCKSGIASFPQGSIFHLLKVWKTTLFNIWL